MEVYNVPDQGLVDMYMIQATQSNSQFAGQVEQFEPMYNEGTPEFYVDQGLYYPTAPNYGYICTGFESPGDWEEHHRVFGLDGLDVQYTGAANENVPYVYYPPGYGYGQSPYNPYNPYIPGAMIGVDGSFVAPQQYYALSSYENSVMSSAYYPMVRPEAIQNGTIDSSVDNGQSVNLIASQVAKQTLPSNFPNSTQAAVGDASSRRNSSMRGSERNRPYAESGKQTVPNFNSGSFLTTTSSQVLRARGPQRTEDVISGKMPSGGSSLKTPLPSANGLSGFESSDHAPSSVHRVKPKLFYGRVPDDVKGNPDALSEQNRGPRTNKSMNQLVVKARTTRAGNPDAQGNITIFTDQYNAVDFPIEYKNAKFFVIKSYSEDDVHKSIKYDVWSSTPNGNKKLNAAYEDAQRIAAGDLRGCPIFLFFSVNASGQFCGVAEMVGPVDFDRDMDFWQQDKWSGCFPVKWHIVKDLPNPNFRHIILENNENKPVTNSRDTQEIPYKKGLEMLKIFKNHTLKTSLLDDFMYYENRQRIMQEERARLLIKSYENPYFIPSLDPPRKLQTFRDIPSVGDLNGPQNEVNNFTIHKKQNAVTDGESSFMKNPHVSTGPASSNNTILNNSKAVGGSDQVVTNGVSNVADELQFSSLTINSREPDSKYPPSGTNSSTSANCESVGVVTIGSMPVKVNASQSSGFLTVGTIPLNPRALLRD